MNNKDFINALATRAALPAKTVQRLTTDFTNEMAERMDDESQFAVVGFGMFEVKKKLERIVVNPATKQRKLIPPKLVLAFRPSSVLKEKLK